MADFSELRPVLQHLESYYQMGYDWFESKYIHYIGDYQSSERNYDNVIQIIYVMFLLFLADNLIVKHIAGKSRWFFLHFVVNGIVVYYVWERAVTILLNPEEGFKLEADYVGLNITFALHLYHVFAYYPISMIDVIHHFLMCSILAFSYFCNKYVNLATHAILLFTNGIPGGIDYFLLTLVKHDMLSPLKEKELNSYLNVWVRSPGIVVSTYIMYLSTIYGKDNFHISTKYLVLSILLWNAQYFTYRVVGNYFKRLTKADMSHQYREGKPLTCDSIFDENNKDEKEVVKELKRQDNVISALIEQMTDVDSDFMEDDNDDDDEDDDLESESDDDDDNDDDDENYDKKINKKSTYQNQDNSGVSSTQGQIISNEEEETENYPLKLDDLIPPRNPFDIFLIDVEKSLGSDRKSMTQEQINAMAHELWNEEGNRLKYETIAKEERDMYRKNKKRILKRMTIRQLTTLAGKSAPDYLEKEEAKRYLVNGICQKDAGMVTRKVHYISDSVFIYKGNAYLIKDNDYVYATKKENGEYIPLKKVGYLSCGKIKWLNWKKK